MAGVVHADRLAAWDDRAFHLDEVLTPHRNRVTPVCCGTVKIFTADAGIDGLKESDLTACRHKGMCFTPRA